MRLFFRQRVHREQRQRYAWMVCSGIEVVIRFISMIKQFVKYVGIHFYPGPTTPLNFMWHESLLSMKGEFFSVRLHLTLSLVYVVIYHNLGFIMAGGEKVMNPSVSCQRKYECHQWNSQRKEKWYCADLKFSQNVLLHCWGFSLL